MCQNLLVLITVLLKNKIHRSFRLYVGRTDIRQDEKITQIIQVLRVTHVSLASVCTLLHDKFATKVTYVSTISYAWLGCMHKENRRWHPTNLSDSSYINAV